MLRRCPRRNHALLAHVPWSCHSGASNLCAGKPRSSCNSSSFPAAVLISAIRQISTATRRWPNAGGLPRKSEKSVKIGKNQPINRPLNTVGERHAMLPRPSDAWTRRSGCTPRHLRAWWRHPALLYFTLLYFTLLYSTLLYSTLLYFTFLENRLSTFTS